VYESLRKRLRGGQLISFRHYHWAVAVFQDGKLIEWDMALYENHIDEIIKEMKRKYRGKNAEIYKIGVVSVIKT